MEVALYSLADCWVSCPPKGQNGGYGGLSAVSVLDAQNRNQDAAAVCRVIVGIACADMAAHLSCHPGPGLNACGRINVAISTDMNRSNTATTPVFANVSANILMCDCCTDNDEYKTPRTLYNLTFRCCSIVLGSASSMADTMHEESLAEVLVVRHAGPVGFCMLTLVIPFWANCICSCTCTVVASTAGYLRM